MYYCQDEKEKYEKVTSVISWNCPNYVAKIPILTVFPINL